MNDEQLSALIQTQATRHTASPRLRADIRARIAVAEASRSEANEAPSGWHAWLKQVFRSRRRVAWTVGTAGFAAGALSAWVAGQLVLTTSVHSGLSGLASATHASAPAVQTASLQSELVNGHVRSLQNGPLLQVSSADRHTVKPWFQGRIDYAPPVLDLSGAGFVLQGGRVERVQGQTVATLVYQHGLHVINLYVWPSEVKQSIEVAQLRGFNLAHWSNGSMQCWVVTDMDSTELNRFGQAWRSALQRI